MYWLLSNGERQRDSDDRSVFALGLPLPGSTVKLRFPNGPHNFPTIENDRAVSFLRQRTMTELGPNALEAKRMQAEADKAESAAQISTARSKHVLPVVVSSIATLTVAVLSEAIELSDGLSMALVAGICGVAGAKVIVDGLPKKKS